MTTPTKLHTHPTVTYGMQFEMPEEYRADMGIGEPRGDDGHSYTGSDSSYSYSEPYFVPLVENRKKTVLSGSSLQSLAQLQLERERAADEAMKQLLGGYPLPFPYGLVFAVGTMTAYPKQLLSGDSLLFPDGCCLLLGL